jgi:hypothetical protein
MYPWPFFLLLAAASAQVFMVVKYDTIDNVPHNIFNFSLSIVSMNVSLLGCADGYWASVSDGKLLCTECVCTTFSYGRNEAFDIVY